MTSQAYTLETIHADALSRIKGLRDAGELSPADYDMITRDSKPDDIRSFLNDAILRRSNSRSIKKTQVDGKVKPLLDWLDRFGGVLDIFASSSPQLHGVNPARLLWGSIKFVVLIARDIVDTFDAILTLLEDIVKALPALQEYINMFGSSKLQLLREPLTDIYAGFIALGLQAMELFNRSTLRILVRSVSSSLETDFKALISRIEKNRTEVDRIAAVEHMHQGNEASRVQLLENQRAEVFRNEQRSHFTNNSGIHNLQTSPLPLSLIDAPLDLLSVHSINRTTELARLDSIFGTLDPHVPRRCAIHGMPGLGKTQLALRYAKLMFDRKQYLLVFWISAATSEKLNQGFANILNLVDHIDRNHPEQSARLIAARRWLEGYRAIGSNAWLLVIDNANRDTVTFLRDNLPRSSYGGSILFTTRTDDVAKALASSAGQEHHTLELQAPKAEDAAHMLLDHAGLDAATVDCAVMDRAKEVVNSVGRLPLAVDQAASFMRQSHKTMEELSELYRSDQKIEAISWENDLSTYEQASVAAAFSMQFKELSRVSPDTYNLMRIFSFLDPESISLNVITDGVDKLRQASLLPSGKEKIRFREKLKQKIGGRRRGKESHDGALSQLPPQLDSLLELLQSPMQFQMAIHKLQSLSLLRQQTGESTPALRIHDLVQFMSQENIRIEGVQQQWFQCAVKLVCGAFTEVDDVRSPACWSICEMFVPHIQAITKYADLHSDEDLLLLAANKNVAHYWEASGRYQEAESLYQRVLAGYDKLLGPTHLDTLLARESLAAILIDHGMYKESETLYKQVLRDMKQYVGPTDSNTLRTMDGFAILLVYRGNYEEAEALFSQVLKGYEKALKRYHLNLLGVSGNLAVIYSTQGQFTKAKSLLKQVLEGLERRLGSEHIDSLQTMLRLANVYSIQGQFVRAESLCKQVLEGQERQLGSEHPDTLWTMSKLAGVYSYQGQYVKAESLYKQVLEGQKRRLGSEHPDTLWTMSKLAGVYSDQDQYVKAASLYKQVLEGQKRQLGSEHPDTLWTMLKLANVYSYQGQYVKAESLYKQVLEGQERRLGSEHPDTLWTMLKLAKVSSDQGQGVKAESLYKKVLEGQERRLGSEHPDTLTFLHDLSWNYCQQGRHQEAEALYKRALAGHERRLGLQHPDALCTIHNLADCLDDQGRFEEADAMWAKLPPNPPQVSAPAPTSNISELPDRSMPIAEAVYPQGMQSRSEAGLRPFFGSNRTESS